MRKRVADLLIETLQAAGVRTCYGIVGDTLNRIAHAIDRSEIDWVHMRHEEAGAFAAGPAKRTTRRLPPTGGPLGPRVVPPHHGALAGHLNLAPPPPSAALVQPQGLGLL